MSLEIPINEIHVGTQKKRNPAVQFEKKKQIKTKRNINNKEPIVVMSIEY